MLLIGERLGLAHVAYRRAVEAARTDSTPASWRRLVTAGRNLREARRDGERSGTPVVAPRPAGKVISYVRPPAARPERWPELARECARSRDLAERSRALISEAMRLRAELAEICAQARVRAMARRGRPA